MKLLFFTIALALDAAVALPALTSIRDDPFSQWSAPGPDDVRSPCPMLNTLANHGFLNHNGKGISRGQIDTAFSTWLNIDNGFAEFIFNNTLLALSDPDPDTATLDLDDLDAHNLTEHDASLSRADIFFNSDDHTFNQTIFDQTKSFFTEPIIDIQAAANARNARIQTSNETNPTFSFDLGSRASPLETAIYIGALGDVVNGNANTSWVVYFFEQERLPVDLGWTTRTNTLTLDLFSDLAGRIGSTASSTT